MLKNKEVSSCNFRPDRAAASIKSSQAVGFPGEILLHHSQSPPSSLLKMLWLLLFCSRDAPFFRTCRLILPTGWFAAGSFCSDFPGF